MKVRATPFKWAWVLLGVLTSSGMVTGCKGDDPMDTERGRVTRPSRSSRVPSKVVEEPAGFEGIEGAGAIDGHLQRRVTGDAGALPISALQSRERLELDALPTRESSGISLELELRQSDLPPPSGAPETATDALDELRSKTRLRLRVEVAAAGRLRVTFLGQGFPWPEGTELRARADKLGHVLVWPDGTNYRNVSPGALRALFVDRRLDMGPLFTPKVTTLPPSQWLGQNTTRTVLTTPVAEVQLDQAVIAGSGLGAALFCRMLLELAGVEPDHPLCVAEQLPLHAQFTNAPGGKLGVYVTTLGKRQELPLASIQVPPEHATLQNSGLPVPQVGSVDRALLAALRHRAVAPATANSTGSQPAPSRGLLAVNRSLSLRALLVDGITVAWLTPGSELALPELRSGQYSVAFRDLFGSSIEPARVLSVPGRVVVGKPPEPAN